MRVLVVDDDPNLISLWCAVFEGHGHICTVAESVSDARKQLMADQFDLVLLDLYVGADTGLSVATLAGYSNPNCKVIVVTGSTLFPRGELFAMAPSIATVLRKPIDIEELVAVCEHHTLPSLAATA